MTFCVVRKSESSGLPEWFGLLALQAAAFASVSPVFHCLDILLQSERIFNAASVRISRRWRQNVSAVPP
jgi:hypothetical protein